MTKLKVEYPARSVRAGTVEIPVNINGHEYYTYMVPGACNLRSFYGLNNINKHGADPAEIIAAIVLSGIGGSIMVFTDAYGRGKDADTLAKFVHANKLGSMVVANGAGNPYMGGGKVVAAVLDYQMPELKSWYDKTFGKAENDGWVSYQRVNMDNIFYQFGGRPHSARDSDAKFHKELDRTLDSSRETLAKKSA
jgi:hypothetical protein